MGSFLGVDLRAVPDGGSLVLVPLEVGDEVLVLLPEAVVEVLQEVLVHNRGLPGLVGAEGIPGTGHSLEMWQERSHELRVGSEIGGLLLVGDDIIVESVPNIRQVISGESLVETVLDQLLRCCR